MNLTSVDYIGILSLAHVLASLWGIYRVHASSMDQAERSLWTLIILLFPIGGVLLFMMFGRRDVKKKSRI